MKRKKIFAISGSTRKNSTNESILRAIGKLYSESLEMHIYNQLDALPYFNPDSIKEDFILSPEVVAFRQQVEQADGVIICTPEYVFSLPGALKNALEWTVSTTVFSYKPFAFIVASASGEKVFESLDLIMKTLLQQPINEDCKLLIKGGRGKINEAGEFTDENTQTAVKKVVDTLTAVIDQHEDTGNERNNIP